MISPVALNLQPSRAWYGCYCPQDLECASRTHGPVAYRNYHTYFTANYFQAGFKTLQLHLIHCFKNKVLA